MIKIKEMLVRLGMASFEPQRSQSPQRNHGARRNAHRISQKRPHPFIIYQIIIYQIPSVFSQRPVFPLSVKSSVGSVISVVHSKKACLHIRWPMTLGSAPGPIPRLQEAAVEVYIFRRQALEKIAPDFRVLGLGALPGGWSPVAALDRHYRQANTGRDRENRGNWGYGFRSGEIAGGGGTTP